jgi:predicted nicotinamide N-methyase
MGVSETTGPAGSARPVRPATPDEALGDLITETIVIDGWRFKIKRPADPDQLLDHPATRAAFARDEYMPYWCEVWPAARMLAKAILRANWPAGLAALELGCGLGLPGIAAMKKGLFVTFSDYDATALRFAADNARLNNCSQFDLLPFDWRQPPDGQFKLILASDLIYEARNVQPVVEVFDRLLGPGGECGLTDQDRRPAELLRRELVAAGFRYTTETLRAGQAAGPGQPAPLRVKGTLYRICRDGGQAIP